MGLRDAGRDRRDRQADHGADPAPHPPLASGEHFLDVVGRGALIALLALLASLAPLGCADDPDEPGADFVQNPDSRLVKVQSVGLAAFGPINPHTAIVADAVLAFGEPSSIDRRGAPCVRRWPDIGLTIRFAAAGGGDPCGSLARIERLRVEGRSAAKAGWRTAEGIRPGMSVEAAKRIYPEARRGQSGTSVLVGPPERHAPPVLAITTARDRVEGLVFGVDAVTD